MLRQRGSVQWERRRGRAGRKVQGQAGRYKSTVRCGARRRSDERSKRDSKSKSAGAECGKREQRADTETRRPADHVNLEQTECEPWRGRERCNCRARREGARTLAGGRRCACDVGSAADQGAGGRWGQSMQCERREDAGAQRPGRAKKKPNERRVLCPGRKRACHSVGVCYKVQGREWTCETKGRGRALIGCFGERGGKGSG